MKALIITGALLLALPAGATAYYCGEGTLIRTLIFWNGKLTRIETAGHGFGPSRCP